MVHCSPYFTRVSVTSYEYNESHFIYCRSLEQLNAFVREQMNQITLPLNLPDKIENITDLHLSLKDFRFSLWSSREREPKTSDYIPIPEVSMTWDM